MANSNLSAAKEAKKKEQNSEASEQQNMDSETQGGITDEIEERQETEAEAHITEEEQNSETSEQQNADSETQNEIIGETEAIIKTEVID